MKKLQAFFLLVAMVLMGYSASLRAEDIDIYVDNSTNDAVPNVLFIMDNGANFSASANGTGCTAYGDGSGEAPSLGSAKASSILQCALVNAINALPNGAVNIGVALSNASNFGETQATTDTTQGGYHERCNASGTGGCIIRKLMLMNATNKASLIKFVKGWKDSGSSTADGFNVKVNTATPGTVMQEAWAYYNGKTGMSNEVYASSVLAGGCQRNFIIYIGNTEKDPANEGNPSPATALAAGQVGATDAQKVGITGTVKFNPPVCGTTTSHTLITGNNWADEWARLMYQQDGGAVGNENAQNIISYSIGILGSANNCSAETLGLMSSIAAQGGGKFFQTSNTTDLTAALSAVLNEVQAVNSVFSSASLPVSVNAEGTFLNQIYLGMFRPDSSGAPRWMGNLKQYQLVKNSQGNFVMGDSAGNPALSSSGTGFLAPDAVSYWTYKDVALLPDSAGGFFKNMDATKLGVLQSTYDSADGEVVEKGGVAQQLRKENLVSTFTGAAGTTANPRRLFTYCPGLTCSSALTDPTNEFSTNNSEIPATAFGSSTNLKINSIVRTGTTALVTTNGNHGFAAGSVVTISNATPSDYNVTQTLTAGNINSATTFTITGLNDNPPQTTTGTYRVATPGPSPASVTSITRPGSGTSNTEVATLTTSAAHGLLGTDDITVSGANQSKYNFSGVPGSASGSTITFDVTISPPATALNTYTVSFPSASYPNLSSKGVTVVKDAADNTKAKVTLSGSTAHGLWAGAPIKLSGNNKINGSWYVTSVFDASSFFITKSSGNFNSLSNSGESGTLDLDTTGKTVTLARTGNGNSATATGTISVSGGDANWFGTGSGTNAVVANTTTRYLTITKTATATGNTANESAYEQSSVLATCRNSTCTSFTYTIATDPPVAATTSTSMTVGQSSLFFADLPAGSITRTAGSTTATVSNVTSGIFTSGQSVTISATGSPVSSESAYTGTWTITCPTVACTSFTISGVTLTPAATASGNMSVYSASSPPDRDTVIKWVRGLDNQADETGPGGSVTVRPSVHGDVLHSRPVVINYGDTRGIIVYYGANDGVFRAVNANQTAAIGSVPAGGELWGLVMKEHYNQLNRLRLNSPEVKFPQTILSTAQPKDYFTDGPTGVYQIYKADGSIDRAIIYLTMRRGGRTMYAVDVTTPTAPTVLWKIDNGTTGFEELGQTWSRPRLTLLQRGNTSNKSTPVLIFGGGYDSAEDSEPPTASSMGRGVYVVNALDGALVWSATPSCAGATDSATCKHTPTMTHSVPSDIRFIDRDANGYTDKLYFGDMGGNVWRADVSTDLTTAWTVTKLAALGCDSGPCSSGTTPRKFFFPPEVLTIKDVGATGSYDAVFIASGDREHPLRNLATGSAYNVSDKAFMIRDTGTTLGTAATSGVTMSTGLFNATSTAYDGSLNGFYITFATGEKAVNAPLTVNGKAFFATNRPVDRTNSCAANLGEAKAYAVSPFTAAVDTNVLAGGGLPPGAVTGLVTVTNADGTSSTTRLCIGCGGVGGDAGAARPANVGGLENTPPVVTIDKNLKRTYWYKK